ncbi:MAG TPA: phage minor head protein, partial [Ktedonobacterales bacterium]|nr:phage minor head protein [Ktedonobacterales bacterium]
ALQDGSPLAGLFATFGPEAADRAGQALFTSLALGENPRVAAQRLQWATDLPRQRAEVIARTEILRSWRSAQLANYRANSDVVQGWQWSCDFSPRSCSACIALDGTTHPLDEELDDHICGRCSALPLTGSWSDILRDAGVAEEHIPASLRAADAQASADARGMGRQTASEWLAQQPPEIQNQIMGPAKAEAWRQGAFSLTDLVGVRHDPQWGSSIQELSLKQLGLDAPTWLAKARAAGHGSALADAETQAAAETSALEMKTGVTQPLGAADSAALSESPVWRQIADTLTPPDAEASASSLDEAQARVDALERQWQEAVAANPNATPYDLLPPETEDALWARARAQAAEDAANGGRGAIVRAYSYVNPFTADEKLADMTEAMFGHALSRDELAGLVGGPEGSYVILQGVDLPAGASSVGLTVALRGPSWNPADPWEKSEYEATRYLVQDGPGDFYMLNASFYVREDMQGQGLGAQIFADQVDGLTQLGNVRYIETSAAGHGAGANALVGFDNTGGENGYYTWPRFGYLGTLPEPAAQALEAAIADGAAPAAWRDYSTIQEIMRTPEGRAWWKMSGTESHLQFDLSAGSLSRRILDTYLREKEG